MALLLFLFGHHFNLHWDSIKADFCEPKENTGLIACHTFKKKEKVKVYVIGEILVGERRIYSKVLPMGRPSSSLVPSRDGLNLHLSKR